jgi:uncharacterized protein (TIGR02996 family)
MSTAESFLQAIREQPHDDAPRLIFADWLEERGDPRGEFVRLQCQRVRLAVHDPLRATAMAQEEERLLRQHRSRWLGPLDQRGVAWEFSRGLLYLCVSADTFLQLDWPALTQTPTWEWVEAMRIRLRGRAGIGALADSPLLACLTALDLCENDLGDEGVAVLAVSSHLGQLRSLNLGFNKISPVGAAVLAQSPHLPRLGALNLYDNHLGDEGLAELAASPHLPELAMLRVPWNYIGPSGATALGNRGGLQALTTLSMGNNAIGDLGAASLARAPGLPRLRTLYLYENGVGAAAAAALRRRFGDRVYV